MNRIDIIDQLTALAGLLNAVRYVLYESFSSSAPVRTLNEEEALSTIGEMLGGTLDEQISNVKNITKAIESCKIL